ncbi:MAG: Holliday junction resolvase RuvX [Bifidobacteriaceae bacterium]|jgi:putative Holliday junction resolvase|nr:Holliday junction resolvase RuvX [Bifidobacteriaceae bacterium]
MKCDFETPSASIFPDVSGPALAIDFGTKRIGLAVSNPERTIALPLPAVKNDAQALEQIRDICRVKQVTQVYLGAPKHLSGEVSAMQKQAERFAKKLAMLTNLPYSWIDERFSSVQATQNLRSLGKNSLQIKPLVDSEAARIILNSALKINE